MRIGHKCLSLTQLPIGYGVGGELEGILVGVLLRTHNITPRVAWPNVGCHDGMVGVIKATEAASLTSRVSDDPLRTYF